MVAGGLAILALTGWSEHFALGSALAQCVRHLASLRRWALASAFAFVPFLIIALIGDFSLPNSLEWDSLSYHLADPAIFAREHRIYSLPWQSHSNFAFTMEMLYCIGIMAKSVALAKLFSFTLSVVAVWAVFRIGKEVSDPATGLVSAIVFATLPIVVWEAGTAYVDLAATCYGTMGLLAIVLAFKRGNSRWLVLAGISLGFMFGIKATAVIPIALLGIGTAVVFVRTGRRQQLGAVLGMLALAAIIGAPWYVKSWLSTGNPVYPFAYHLFGGRYWDGADAAKYAQDQASFGMGHALADLISSPWNVTMFPMPGHALPIGVTRPFNDLQTPFVCLSPLFLGLLFAPLMRVRAPRDHKMYIACLGVYAAAFTIIWFFLTQQLRYLLPIVPVYSVLAAHVLVSLVRERSFSGYAALCVQVVVSVSTMLFFLPLAAGQVDVLSGAVTARDYAARSVESVPAFEFLNAQTPRDAGVALFGEPRGFYLNRRYLWAEQGHSLYVPYRSFRSPDDLRHWFLNHGYTFVLVNWHNAPLAPGTDAAGMAYALTAGSGAPPVYEDRNVSVYSLSTAQAFGLGSVR
jgi:hypothetical protein